MKTRYFLYGAMACAGLAVAGIAAAATPWRSDLKQSSLTFAGEQAGAPFSGVFEKFTPTIQFDPKDLATSRFDVAIDLKSVNSKDKERDDTIKSPDFFSVEKWPTGRYVTGAIVQKSANTYTSTGKLTLRDATRDVPIEFTFTTDATGAWLRGSGVVKRLEFGVGQGDWKDTSWVGNDIKITFAIRLASGS